MEIEHGKLFIGGISWDTNEERLREYFQIFGEVMETVIMKDRTTGRARGFGFVVFADPVVAERVVREKHIIDGRTVEAKKAVPRDDQHIFNRNNNSNQGSPSHIRTKKIFVGGLASTVTESDFKNYFDQFGTITDVVVMYDHQTQRPRGFGFITYDLEESVEKVLHKTFHELNSKMVEVKRAVPKDLSPGPSRNQLGGYNNHSPSRFSSFLNAYNQGYNPSAVRHSPANVERSGYSPFSPSGYGMGLNFELGLSSGYGQNGNISSNLGYGRRLSPLLSGTSNSFGGGSGGIGSVLNSSGRNLWWNGSLNYAPSSSNSVGAFDNIGAIWGSSPMSGQGGGADIGYSGGNISRGSGENGFGSGGGGYGRTSGSSVGPPSSYGASSDGSGGASGNFYGGGFFYGDPTWRSSSPELEGSGSFGYGLGNETTDVTTRNSAGYVGGYSVTNRSNGGIAA